MFFAVALLDVIDERRSSTLLNISLHLSRSGFLAPKVNSSTAFTLRSCDPKSINDDNRTVYPTNIDHTGIRQPVEHSASILFSILFRLHIMMLYSAFLFLCFLARKTLAFNLVTSVRQTGNCLYNALQPMEADNASTQMNTRRNVLESFISASVLSTAIFTPSIATAADGVDYKEVAEDIKALVVKTPDWGPTLVRLAWHSSGTYDKMLKNGGSGGGTIRFKEELAHGGNAGLADTAVSWMDPIYAKYKDQGLSYADLYTLGGGKYCLDPLSCILSLAIHDLIHCFF